MERMLKKVAHEGGCWVWQGALTPDGYPRVGRNGNPNIRGHRYFFEQVKGEIPEGQVIRHTCDNTRCINPDHLVLGTVDQNVQDRTDRARTANHKTDEHIEQILELRSTTDLPQWRVAEIVGCSQAYVSKVERGIYKRLTK